MFKYLLGKFLNWSLLLFQYFWTQNNLDQKLNFMALTVIGVSVLQIDLSVLTSKC